MIYVASSWRNPYYEDEALLHFNELDLEARAAAEGDYREIAYHVLYFILQDG